MHLGRHYTPPAAIFQPHQQRAIRIEAFRETLERLISS